MFGSKARAEALDDLDRGFNRILGRLDRLESAPQPESPASPTDPAVTEHLETLQAGADSARFDLIDLERKLKELTFAVDEGIERVSRADRRIKATVQRARKELQDRGYADPGLEAEAHQLRVVDGDPSETGGVPPVPAEVAEPDDAPSSIRGVSASDLQRVRGA